MQDGVIFSESIARNIAVNDGDIDVERLEQAAKIANIHEYVMGLPLKYNTLIGRDGVGLSQGQKQRILIARAVYKNPDFIFLDEATNALDAKNERAIVENLDEFYKGRTVVVVAHRLSTVKNADQIIVLDGGKVVEVGNHTSLIEKKGAYYNLVKNNLNLETKMETSNHSHDKIELRSEKVRKLIGEIPPSLVRCGTAIIAIVFLALLSAVCLLPYPYSNGESIIEHLISP